MKLTQLAPIALLACAMALSACANTVRGAGQDVKATANAVEETVQYKIEANALSEADAEKVNELLDEADALCTEGKFPEASATLATINKMVAAGQ